MLRHNINGHDETLRHNGRCASGHKRAHFGALQHGVFLEQQPAALVRRDVRHLGDDEQVTDPESLVEAAHAL